VEFLQGTKDIEARDMFVVEFYNILKMIDDGIHSFPPCENIFKQLVASIGYMFLSIGRLFVLENLNEMQCIFEFLKEKKNITLLAPIFNPYLVPSKFLAYYKDLSLILENENASIVFNQFKIETSIDPNLFMNLILDACGKWKDTPATLVVHCALLSKLLQHNLPLISEDTLEKIVTKVLNEQYPERLIKYLTY
jgi:hypothetical protein